MYTVLNKEFGKNAFDKAATEFKKNSKLGTYETVLSKSPTLKGFCSTSALVADQIQRAITENRALQPCIIDECMVFELYAAQNDYTLVSLTPNEGRALYKHANGNILTYYGDPNHKDIVISTPSKETIIGEVKSEISRAGDEDLAPYNFHGETAIRPGTTFDIPEGHKIIKAFNNYHRDWKNASNFKMCKYPELFDVMSKFRAAMIKPYFEKQDKKVQFCIVVFDNSIICYDIDDDFYNTFDYSDSEIRITGKNSRRICGLETVKLFENWCNENNIAFGENISVPLKKLILIKGRGKTDITRYAFGSHMIWIKAADLSTKTDEYITFLINKVNITTPNMSIHLKFKEPKNV